MARNFKPIDVKRLTEQFRFLQSGLENTVESGASQRQAIVDNINRLIVAKQEEILLGVPVETLAQEKSGIRYNALRDAGYTTYAHLYNASVWTLSNINGISENTAYTIKQIVENRAANARTTVKIRLSTDDVTPDTTAVVCSVAILINCNQYIAKCQQLLNYDKLNIQYAFEDLAKAQGSISWIFLSKDKKERAERAYQYISSLMYGAYAGDARAAMDAVAHYSTIYPNDAWKQFAANSIQFYNVIEQVVPGVLGNNDTRYGLPEELAREIEEECLFPDGLLCTLRRYQELGVKYILHQERVLLGDEMGLGKTVQAIAAMVSLRNTGATHFMVICPASVLSNWCKEISKHSRLRPIRVHGTGKATAFREWKQNGGVAVTTYETTGSLNIEDEYEFSMMVVDEAHYIKNPEAKRTKNVIALSQHAERLLFMTGTALENHVGEMIQLLSVLQPDIAYEANKYAFMASAPEFREIVAPVYYRRKREDVLTELPELIETEEWVDLLPYEESVYEACTFSKNFNDMRRVSWHIDDMRQSSKAIRMQELVEEATEEGRKVLVFSFFLDTTRKVQMLLGNRCTQIINGSVSPQRRQEIIDEFETAPAGSVLVAQILAGGTGLNIQSASVVIICEPQLKPSIENQAISRAYRMGQTRNVLVYRLLCDDTIDERIMEKLAAKQAEFDAFADISEAAEAQKELALDNKSQNEIIEEEIERIKKKNNLA